MAMSAVKRRWTAREVRQLIAESPLATPRYELVDGELLVTPSPNWPHQRAIAILVRELGQYLTAEPVGHVGLSPLWHRVAAAKQFRLDLLRYFAEVFG